MKKISNLLILAVLAIGMGLTSCEGALDDILGEWSRPTPGNVTPGKVTAVSITTAPTATAGSILVGSTTALVTAGVADGGTVMYKVTTDNTQPTSTDGFSAEIPTAAALAVGTYFVWYYAKAADAQHTDSEIAATPVEVTVLPTLSTPLTVEVLSEGAGTIVIKSPKENMKYSKNGATPTTITSTADVTIDVTKGDKVAFYGNGTSINNYNGTQIVGGTAQVKVYGNIMSLLDETGFETKTDLPNDTFVFCDLFRDNTNLTDASGLLLPAEPLAQDCYSNMFMGCTSLTTAPELKATTLAHGCYADMFEGCTALTTAPELKATTLAHGCYTRMFEGCTSLTTAPELKATTLAYGCYTRMFKGCTALTVAPELKAEPLAGDCYFHMFEGCTKLTTAYVKAGYDANCADMFKGCTATGAKLHTTSGNKSSWDNEMGSGKTWPTWTAVDDWN